MTISSPLARLSGVISVPLLSRVGSCSYTVCDDLATFEIKIGFFRKYNRKIDNKANYLLSDKQSNDGLKF